MLWQGYSQLADDTDAASTPPLYAKLNAKPVCGSC